MSTREEGKRQVAGEDRKEHLDIEGHSDGHINNLSLFSRVTGHSTETQKCPACQSQTLQEVP